MSWNKNNFSLKVIVKCNNVKGYFTFVLQGNEKNRRKELRNLFLNVISADVCAILNSVLSERQKSVIGIAFCAIQETLLSTEGGLKSLGMLALNFWKISNPLSFCVFACGCFHGSVLVLGNRGPSCYLWSQAWLLQKLHRIISFPTWRPRCGGLGSWRRKKWQILRPSWKMMWRGKTAILIEDRKNVGL